MAQKGFVPPLLSREEYCIMDFVVVLFGAIFGIMIILEFLFVLGTFVHHSALFVTCFGLLVIQFRTNFSVHCQLARCSSC